MLLSLHHPHRPHLYFCLYSMLYRNHFLFSSLSPFTASLPLSSSSSSFRVVEQEMEAMQNVLNGDIRTDMADFKPTLYYNHASTAASSAAPLQSALSDDMSAVNGQNGQTGDDFSVDDLLDFSNVVMDDAEEEQKQEFFDTAVAADVKTTFSNVICTTDMAFCSPLPPTELTVPADDLENLEWLSHFVEDSFSEYSMVCPVMKPPPELQKSQSGEGTMTIVEKKPALPTPVQTKARTKRARTGLRVWSLGSPPLTESSTGSSSSSSSSMSSSCQPSFCQTQVAESLLGKPPVKKPKKKPTTMVPVGGGGCVGGGQQPRRCSHCGVQKTPQWRAGPLGVKTLCNACGVRFKSGRLLPEYRPACSPTFSSELHSNNHRKVLEMRQKKDLPAGFSPPVQSF